MQGADQGGGVGGVEGVDQGVELLGVEQGPGRLEGSVQVAEQDSLPMLQVSTDSFASLCELSVEHPKYWDSFSEAYMALCASFRYSIDSSFHVLICLPYML